MIRSDLSFSQIYNELLTGVKLVLSFANEADAENFRTRMHHHKANQEKVLEGLGFSNADERTVLSFKVEKERKEGGTVVAYTWFSSPKALKKYPVLILEKEDLESGKEVPKNLGESKE